MSYGRVLTIAALGTIASILLSHSYLSVKTLPSNTRLMPAQIRIALEKKRRESFHATDEELTEILPNPNEVFEQHNEKDLSSFQVTPSACNMDSCFDYSRCPITKPLKFYLYPLPDDRAQSQMFVDNRNSLHSVLRMNGQRVDDPETACIFIYIVYGCDEFSVHIMETVQLHNDGKNHVVWNFCTKTNIISEEPRKEDTMHNNFSFSAIFVTDAVDRRFRPDFDILAGHMVNYKQAELSPLLHTRRKYLASVASCGSAAQSFFLKLPTSDMTVYRFPTKNECGQDSLLLNILKNSTFSFLILPPGDVSLLQGRSLQYQLHAMLKHGVIPVVIGTRFVPPFDDVLDWSKVMITIPPGRIAEMDTILQSISDDDILSFRKNGRMLFERYFSSVQVTAETVLGALRTRIGLIPTPYEDNPSPSVYNDTFMPRKRDALPIHSESRENLGPFPVRSKSSRKFKNNFTTNFLGKYDAWNTRYQPFNLYPYTPWDGSLPTFADSSTVSEASGHQNTTMPPKSDVVARPYDGMTPDEQFTIVMLTYKREAVLTQTLQRLYPVPYLNKIVIVWNAPDPPSEDLTWPDIKVPLEIIRPERNSLNNRFLPFGTIETEAVMSLDDDSPLEPEDIVFGFSVWLENRDRIVGYPARLHRWNSDLKTWYYQPTDDCKISLVLTGAAFFHKVYMYKYTYEMPSVIRDKVDELMNCEDIAMNFLIAHVTQKPPIKVTARRNFDCQGCKSALSQAAKHYEKRSSCIPFLEKVYGYVPLRYTISRMDSIYYNTGEVKHSDPPCFKNV